VTRTRAVAAAVLLVMLIPATPCGSSEGDDGLEAIIGTELTSGCSDSRFSERRDVAGVVGYALVACGSADQSAIKITNLTNAVIVINSTNRVRPHYTTLTKPYSGYEASGRYRFIESSASFEDHAVGPYRLGPQAVVVASSPSTMRPLYEEPKLVVQFDTKGSTEIILTDVVTNYLSGLATPKSRSLAESATACIVGATSLVTNRQGLTQDIVNAFPCILLFNQIVGHGEVPSGQAAGQGGEAGVRRSKLWSELLEFVGKAIVVAHGP